MNSIFNATEVLDPPLLKARRVKQNTSMVKIVFTSNSFNDAIIGSNMDEIESITS